MPDSCGWLSRVEARRKNQTPFFFEVNQGQLFAFAGAWDRWKDPNGNWIKTCSILTTTPTAAGGEDLQAAIESNTDCCGSHLWRKKLSLPRGNRKALPLFELTFSCKRWTGCPSPEPRRKRAVSPVSQRLLDLRLTYSLARAGLQPPPSQEPPQRRALKRVQQGRELPVAAPVLSPLQGKTCRLP